ncbi:MAG: monoheme cytochrome C [Flammeovirgaceae bacterium]|jgi:hypothetical protein|nr:monoheme cytochrome C [Flammeovirgaceae bacterium]|tara:strand:+ start:6127 stop:6603 length:477 start_codon:yes stop_codon:yes gene_type:complete
MAEDKDFNNIVTAIRYVISMVLGLVIITSTFFIYYLIDPNLTSLQHTPEVKSVPVVVVEDENKIENGIHVRTGLVDAEGLMTVVNNCTNCHSSKIILQNRMNAERWNATIKWMQQTQNLWDLGKNQDVIVNYLVTNYPPKSKGRRENLSKIEWYALED